MSTLKKVFSDPRYFPICLLWLTVLSYGITLPWLGLYSDDWPFLYVYETAGLSGVADFLAWSRPLAGWLYGLIVAPFGWQFWAFHLVFLFLRWATGVFFWQLVRRIFPGQERCAAWAAALLVVYPAFKQQPLAVEYILHFIVLNIFLFSLWSMLNAAEDGPRTWLWRVLGWIFSLHFFIIEYFAGLELLRPALLWMVLRRSENDPRRRARRVLAEWVPYLLTAGGFVFWRLALHPFSGYPPALLDALKENLGGGLLTLGQRVLEDSYTVLIGTWVQVFSTFPAGARLTALWAAVVLAAFFSLGFYFWRFHPSSGEQRAPRREGMGIFLLGLYAVLISGAPQWVTLIPLRLTFPWDRSTLPFIVGVSLAGAGAIGLLRERRAQTVLISLLLAFSIGLHLQNANTYRKEWDILTRFFWQLTTRIPGLEPGTIVSLDESPFAYHVDKFLTPLLNWSYAPDSPSLKLPYIFYDFYKLDQRFPDLAKGEQKITWGYGNLDFTGSNQKIVLAAYSPPACLQVLTPAEDGARMLTPATRKYLELSRPDSIQPEPAVPARPPAFLGVLPPLDWCYYYEKADLARQQQNWEEAARLGEEALEKGLRPGYPSEWLVFIESNARAGLLERAFQLSREIPAEEYFQKALCRTWQRLALDLPAAQPALQEFNCN